MSEIRLCVDCIHFGRSEVAAVYDKCHRYGEPNLVRGGITPIYAELARLMHGACGHEGRGWELYAEQEVPNNE